MEKEKSGFTNVEVVPGAGKTVAVTGTATAGVAGADIDGGGKSTLPVRWPSPSAEEEALAIWTAAAAMLAMPFADEGAENAFRDEDGVVVRGVPFTLDDPRPLRALAAGEEGDDSPPGTLPSFAFQRFLTAFSVRPGNCLAISAHFGPSSPYNLTMARSSSSLHGRLSTSGEI